MTRGSARIHPQLSLFRLCSFVVQQQRGFNYATLLLYKHRMHDVNPQSDGNRENLKLKGNRKSTLALTSRKEEE